MKAIVSIVGKDQVGIIANVCSELAACNINILEISQKIMDGFFTGKMPLILSLLLSKLISPRPFPLA